MANRPRIKAKMTMPVTSSNKRTAFMMNEINATFHIKGGVEKKRPYIKIFGKEVFIQDGEVKEYTEHKITIYYK